MKFEMVKFQYQLEKVLKKTRYLIFLDNNLFRLLKRDPKFWHNFFKFFESEYPSAFENIEFVFTWQQILEDINLGRIISQKIKSHPLWQQKINTIEDNDSNSLNKALDNYFDVACEIASILPELQPEALLKKIDASILRAHSLARPLVEQTLIKAKFFIEKNNYIKALSTEIAWALITSHDFINLQQKEQLINRKQYFNVLIKVWHDLFLKKRELDFYRIIDKQYQAHLSSLGLPSLEKNVRLKSGSDLCDSLQIHYAAFGIKKRGNERHSVISITMTNKNNEGAAQNVYMRRIGIGKQSLIDLQRDVIGWNINVTPGEILILTLDGHKVASGYRIPFNIPFSDQTS